jgi:DNA-binding Lrp family transcriptional regulator
MFYITISNGLLQDEHRKKIGSAVWEFMWCIDKVTRIDEDGKGWVLGGKPIKLKEIADAMKVDEDTVSTNLTKLEKEGYISKLRTPYGIQIKVMNTKKRFGKNSDSGNRENSVSHRRNSVSNKTIQLDSTVNTEDEHSSSSKEIPELIKLFEIINPACKRYYGNKTQRKACEDLISTYGFERVEKVVSQALPKTNELDFFPTITTPLQLFEKWSALEAAIKKHNNKKHTETKKAGAIW